MSPPPLTSTWRGGGLGRGFQGDHSLTLHSTPLLTTHLSGLGDRDFLFHFLPPLFTPIIIYEIVFIFITPLSLLIYCC